MEAKPRLLLITSEWPVVKDVKHQAEALQGTGLSVEVFAFRGRGFYSYAAAWTSLRPRLHTKRYDLVHAQDASDVLLALPKRVPLVVTVGKQDLQRLLRQLVALFLARRADAVIVGSEEMRGQVRTRAPVHVVPPDLDGPVLAARLVEVYRSILPERFSAS